MINTDKTNNKNTKKVVSLTATAPNTAYGSAVNRTDQTAVRPQTAVAVVRTDQISVRPLGISGQNQIENINSIEDIQPFSPSFSLNDIIQREASNPPATRTSRGYESSNVARPQRKKSRKIPEITYRNYINTSVDEVDEDPNYMGIFTRKARRVNFNDEYDNSPVYSPSSSPKLCERRLRSPTDSIERPTKRERDIGAMISEMNRMSPTNSIDKPAKKKRFDNFRYFPSASNPNLYPPTTTTMCSSPMYNINADMSDDENVFDPTKVVVAKPITKDPQYYIRSHPWEPTPDEIDDLPKVNGKPCPISLAQFKRRKAECSREGILALAAPMLYLREIKDAQLKLCPSFIFPLDSSTMRQAVPRPEFPLWVPIMHRNYQPAPSSEVEMVGNSQNPLTFAPQADINEDIPLIVLRPPYAPIGNVLLRDMSRIVLSTHMETYSLDNIVSSTAIVSDCATVPTNALGMVNYTPPLVNPQFHMLRSRTEETIFSLQHRIQYTPQSNYGELSKILDQDSEFRCTYQYTSLVYMDDVKMSSTYERKCIEYMFSNLAHYYLKGRSNSEDAGSPIRYLYIHRPLVRDDALGYEIRVANQNSNRVFDPLSSVMLRLISDFVGVVFGHNVATIIVRYDTGRGCGIGSIRMSKLKDFPVMPDLYPNYLGYSEHAMSFARSDWCSNLVPGRHLAPGIRVSIKSSHETFVDIKDFMVPCAFNQSRLMSSVWFNACVLLKMLWTCIREGDYIPQSWII
jgi:hypothetical protein